MDDLRAGAIDVMVIWKLDRLTRQGIRQIAPLLDVLEACNAALLSVHDPIDTSSAMGEGVLGMLASMAKQESENKSVRIRRSKRHHAEAGRHSDGGNRPFGLSRAWSELVPEEAALIREAAERILAVESLRSIVLDWRARGIPTFDGRTVADDVATYPLLEPRLYGARVYDGRVVALGTWPTILDEATRARLRAVLCDPARRPGPPVHAYLLTGFLRCGRRMRSVQPKGAKRAYQCPSRPQGCSQVSIIGEPTEREVVAQVLAALFAQHPGLLSELASSSRSLVVSPSRSPPSISTCRTHARTAVSVRSRSRDTSAIVLPLVRTRSTTLRLERLRERATGTGFCSVPWSP